MNDAPTGLTHYPSATGRRVFITSTCTTEILNGTVRARRTTWGGLSEDVFEDKLENYRAVGMARGWKRSSVFDRYGTSTAQVTLIHKFDRHRDLVLWETPADMFDADVPMPDQRRTWETLSQTLNLPAIARADADGVPVAGDVFNYRQPGELSWGIRDFVAHGRLSVSRNLPEPPAGVRISQSGSSAKIDFRYSSIRELWRGLRVLLAISVFSLFGGRRYSRSLTWSTFKFLLVVIAILVFCFCLVVLPMLHFMNGSTMEIDEKRIIYRPGQGVTVFPSVKWEYVIPIAKIEGIRYRGFHVLVETDGEVVQILCPGPNAARWFQLMLMAVAAHGPSVLATKIEPAPKA